MLKHIMLESGNFVICKCGNAMELVQGKVDYKVKDDKGRLLTR